MKYLLDEFEEAKICPKCDFAFSYSFEQKKGLCQLCDNKKYPVNNWRLEN